MPRWSAPSTGRGVAGDILITELAIPQLFGRVASSIVPTVILVFVQRIRLFLSAEDDDAIRLDRSSRAETPISTERGTDSMRIIHCGGNRMGIGCSILTRDEADEVTS